jgi:hypothetical protein
MNVTLDTGSDWLIVQADSSCYNCEGSMFEQTASSSYVNSGVEMQLMYGSAGVYGYQGTDQFYLDNNKNFGLSSFEFMLILYQYGIAPTGGIMGFSRNFALSTKRSTGPLYYQYLKSAGKTSANIFATYYADTSD